MAKKNKYLPFKSSDVYSQGKPTKVIQEFIEYFLKPFAKEIGEKYRTDSRLLIAFFHLNTRRLRYARANADFKMPGDLYITANRTEQGTGKRRIFEDDLFIICLDETMEYVKIEFVKTEEEFQLNKGQYKFFESKIRFLV